MDNKPSNEIFIPAGNYRNQAQTIYDALIQSISGISVNTLSPFLLPNIAINNNGHKKQSDVQQQLIRNLPESGIMLIDLNTCINNLEGHIKQVIHAIEKKHNAEISGLVLIGNDFEAAAETAIHARQNIIHHTVSIVGGTTDITSPNATQVYKSQKQKSDGNWPVITILSNMLFSLPETTSTTRNEAEENIARVLNYIREGFGTGTHIITDIESSTEVTPEEINNRNTSLITFFKHAQKIGVISDTYKPEEHWKLEHSVEATGQGEAIKIIYMTSLDDHNFTITNPFTKEMQKATIKQGEQVPITKSRIWSSEAISQFISEKTNLRLIDIYSSDNSRQHLIHLTAPKIR